MSPLQDLTADVGPIGAQALQAVAGITNERSDQVALGWSEVGGCRACIAHRLRGDEPSDAPDTWRARVGTEMHAALLPVIAEALGAEFEVETRFGGILGHADCTRRDLVLDMKFPSLARVHTYQSEPSLLYGYRMQVQGYAAGLVEAGRCDAEGLQCVVLMAPVDGRYTDWWADIQPFDRDIADAGVARVQAVQDMLDRDEFPGCDKGFAFCSQYCPYGRLQWPDGDADGSDEITDPDAIAVVSEYGTLAAQIRELEKRRDELKPALAGLRGVAGAWRVAERAGRASIDTQAVTETLSLLGIDVPMRRGAPYAVVTRARRAQ